VSPERREAAGRAFADHVLSQSRVRSAPRVALYAALADELPTRALFEGLRAAGRRCLLPRIGEGSLEFALVSDWGELQPAQHGVLAPPPDRVGEVLAPQDVAIVPGVAFDQAGRRLGRGGGYYDRAFADRRRSPLLVGAGYAFQVVAEVPADSRDRAVDAIVTERGFRWLEVCP
jgi:5-formyltetrahydrofolate cyclo-ligase